MANTLPPVPATRRNSSVRNRPRRSSRQRLAALRDEFHLLQPGAPHHRAHRQDRAIAEHAFAAVCIVDALDAAHRGGRPHVDAAFAQARRVERCQRLVEGAEDPVAGLHQRDRRSPGNHRATSCLRKSASSVVNSQLAAPPPTTKGEEARALVGAERRVGRALEALEDAVPDLARVVQVLEEEDLLALALRDARRVKRVRFVANGEDEIIVRDVEGRTLEDVLELHGAVRRIEAPRLGLIYSDSPCDGSHRLLNRAKLERANRRARQHRREEEVVALATQDAHRI